MKKQLSLVLLSALLSTAHADGGLDITNPFDEDGQPAKFYAGAGLGYAINNDSCTASFLSNIECEDGGLAWKAYGGVRLNPMFGIEGGYRQFNDVKLTGTDGSGNSSSLDKKIAGFDLEAVGYFPIADSIEAFGKVGAMYWTQDTEKVETLQTTSSSETGTSLLLGAGAEYKMNENIKLRGEWERVFGTGGTDTPETDIDMYSAGLTFSAF